MICPNCKLNAPKGMKFCPVCGTAFSAVATVSDEERARQEKAYENSREEEAARKKREEDEPIYIDPSKTYLHDREEDEQQSFGFGGLFDGFFGGSIFGSPFSSSSSGKRRTTSASFGGGLFDIIEDLFGFGGGGGGYIDSNRAQIAERDDFYHIDEFDEDGFPIIMKDKLIDISPRELEKIKRDEERNKKHDKKNRDGEQ